MTRSWLSGDVVTIVISERISQISGYEETRERRRSRDRQLRIIQIAMKDRARPQRGFDEGCRNRKSIS
jgi:flagellar basal body L-ring protein FlgH